MHTTLTERYIDAVTRAVPEKQRADVAGELRASIADQIDARVEVGEAVDTAEREVLTALGDPDALAAGFADRPLHLIGPRFYLTWKRLLIVLLWIVPVCAAAAVALGQSLAGESIGHIVANTIAMTLSIIVHLCFWVTVVFVVLERTGASALTPWTLDDLPAPRGSGAGVADLIAGVVLSVLLAGALIWDALVGFVHLQGQWHSFLGPQMWPWWTGALLVVIAAEIALAVAVFARGRWTTALAVVNAALAVIAASILLTALGRGLLINAELIDVALGSGASADLPHVLGVITGFAVVGVAAWDAIDGFLKARRAGAS